jgi:phosphoribosylanthranilate isomerase
MAKRQREQDGPIVHLRCVGFCGADDSVEPGLLAAISLRHPWVEWGVLFRKDKQGQPRYASPAWLKQLSEVNAERTMRLAGHLCSCRVDELLRGDTAFVRQMHEDVGFTRFQINATAANGSDIEMFASDEGADRCVVALRGAFASLPQVEFILQRNKQTMPLWQRLLKDPPSNMSILFDDSMGLGVSASNWPAPPESLALKFGYAGGLAPSNIAEQLSAIANTAVRCLPLNRSPEVLPPLRIAHLAHCALPIRPIGGPNAMGGHGVFPSHPPQRRYRHV